MKACHDGPTRRGAPGGMEAVRAGRTITRIALAFEAGRDGFWLARWLEARGVEAHVDPSLSLCGPPTDISSEN